MTLSCACIAELCRTHAWGIPLQCMGGSAGSRNKSVHSRLIAVALPIAPRLHVSCQQQCFLWSSSGAQLHAKSKGRIVVSIFVFISTCLWQHYFEPYWRPTLTTLSRLYTVSLWLCLYTLYIASYICLLLVSPNAAKLGCIEVDATRLPCKLICGDAAPDLAMCCCLFLQHGSVDIVEKLMGHKHVATTVNYIRSSIDVKSDLRVSCSTTPCRTQRKDTPTKCAVQASST